MMRVEPYNARFDLRYDAVETCMISRPDACAQTEAAIIGKLDSMCIISKRYNTDDWTKDFFLPDGAAAQRYFLVGGQSARAAPYHRGDQDGGRVKRARR